MAFEIIIHITSWSWKMRCMMILALSIGFWLKKMDALCGYGPEKNLIEELKILVHPNGKLSEFSNSKHQFCYVFSIFNNQGVSILFLFKMGRSYDHTVYILWSHRYFQHIVESSEQALRKDGYSTVISTKLVEIVKKRTPLNQLNKNSVPRILLCVR